MSAAKQPDPQSDQSLPFRGVPEFLVRWLHRGPFRRPLVYLGLAFMLCAIALSLPHWYASYLRVRYALPVAPQSTESEFHVLAYAGPGAAQAPSVATFREHLQALHEAGFTLVGLRDIRALLQEGRPLPKRAVLVTVDGCTASAWPAWRRAVLQARGRAILFVDPLSKRRPSWHSLRYAVLTPHWEIGVAYWQWPPRSGGRPAPEPKTSTGVRRDDMFRTARRHDRIGMAEQQVLARHADFRRRLPHPFPRPVMALAHVSEGVQDPLADGLRAHAMAETATDVFDLVFVTGNLSLNHRHSDPRRLNRLRVRPEWRGRDLVERLHQEARAPFRLGLQPEKMKPIAWIQTWGRAGFEDESVVLSNEHGTPLTALSIAGSEQLSAFTMESEFWVRRGVLRFVLRAEPDESTRTELRVTEEGTVALVQVDRGQTTTLAVDRIPAPLARTRMQVVVRDAQLGAMVDGRRLFSGWVHVGDHPPSGRMGVRLESMAGPGEAEARLFSMRVAPESTVVAICDLLTTDTAQALEWLGRRSAEISAISPPLPGLEAGGDALGMDTSSLIGWVGRIHRWKVYPYVSAGSAVDLERLANLGWAERVRAVGGHGLLIRFRPGAARSPNEALESVRRVASELQKGGLRLLVQFPDAWLSSIRTGSGLAVIPGVQWVVGAESPTEIRAGAAMAMDVTAAEVEEDLRTYFEIMSASRRWKRDEARERIRRWRSEAEDLYAAGELEGAIGRWLDWHESESANAYPLRRIGDALLQLDYQDEAVDFYRQSLERDPGNVLLALQVVELMAARGQRAAAGDLLRAYSVVFPRHDGLLLAQARWAREEGRLEEAGFLARQAVEANPHNWRALLFLAELSRDPEEFRVLSERLARAGRETRDRDEIWRSLYESHLLGMIQAQPLVETLLRLPEAELKSDPVLSTWRAIVTPRAEPVTESLQGQGLSAAWRLDGATMLSEPRRLVVTALPGREEFSVRLSGTDRWRDGFIEVEWDEVADEAWLVARRSAESLTRLGFVGGRDELLLQLWRRENDSMILRQYESVPWAGRISGLRLRLEVRGHAAVAYVQRRTWRGRWLALPRDMTAGWFGVVGRASAPGRASLGIRQISAGPLFPCIALLGREIGSSLEASAATLRSLAEQLNAVAPAWFEMQAGGVLRGRADSSDDFVRLFARYHGLRLLPRIRVARGVVPRAADLRDGAQVHRVDGFVLEFSEAPAAAFLAELDQQLWMNSIDVIALVPDRADPSCQRVLGLGRASLLLPGAPDDGYSAVVLGAASALREKEAHWKSPVLIRLEEESESGPAN